MTRPGRPTSHDLIATVFDAGTWRTWDSAPVQPTGPGSAYAAELAAAAERAGTDEAIVTGEGRIRGHRVAAIVGEFGFLAGSIGRAAAYRVVAAVERATAEGLPLFAAPSSGGTRMQEGTPAFVTMVAISDAISRFKAARLPYITYLRHPTTGGVFASWGSLGHVTVAEPGATIGFLGARVYAALYGEPFPEGVQVAENLYENGLLDAILPLPDLAETAARFLDIVTAVPAPQPDAEPWPAPEHPVPAWESVTRSRRPDRPTVRTLLKLGADDVLPLHGTGSGETDQALLLALATFGGAPCVVLGQDRPRTDPARPLSPGGLRVARRGMRLAEELALPLVSVIDTAGAALSREAEEGGMAGEIARSLAELVSLEVPTICVLLGQGTGGGALALLPADRVLSAEHSWLSPLPPEGASAILYRVPDRADEMAERQRIRSHDLLADGIVDEIVPEFPDAAQEPAEFSLRLAAALRRHLGDLVALDPADRLDARRSRFRRMTLGG